MCVCDIEDSGDSLLKQYNGHLSPRGVIQIQYQARTFSTPLSALRRGHSVYCCRGLKEKPGGQRHMHPVNQSVRETRKGRVEGKQEDRTVCLECTKPAHLLPRSCFLSVSDAARWGAFGKEQRDPRERASWELNQGRTNGN